MRGLAKLAVAATVAAPGFSATFAAEQVEHWERAVGGSASALRFLIESAWTEGEARERGIAVSDRELRELVDERPHDGLTRADIRYDARIGLLRLRIRDQITRPAALSVTPEQVEAYVQAHPRQDPETRRVRIVQARTRHLAHEAQRKLARGLLWRSAARRYSISGGSGPKPAEPGSYDEDVERAIFKAPEKRLTRYRTFVFKVVEIIPAHPTPLDQQRATAWEILASDAQQQALTAFQADFTAKWRARTTCAPEYATAPDCGNPPNSE